MISFILTKRWALFFFAMAILNEIIWRTQSTDFWVAFKAFGVIPLTMGFAITQMPLTKRYHLEPASLEASEAEAGDVTKGGATWPGRGAALFTVHRRAGTHIP